MRKPRSVDRDRLRERDRQARAAMSVHAEQAARASGDSRHSHHHHAHHGHGHHVEADAHTSGLFRAPVRVITDAHDRTTQQIQSKLGNYSLVKHLLFDDRQKLIGIEGVPASPAPASSNAGGGAGSRLSACSSSSGAGNRSSPSAQEFKKPGASGPRSSSSSASSNVPTSSSSSQRGGFVKPADGKPPYGGRGGYPGQPIKHGSSSNEHRSHGLMTAKGPPAGGGAPPADAPSSMSSSSSTSGGNGQSSLQSRMHQASVRIPKLAIDNAFNSRHLSADSTAEVETILKEMTMPPTPLTAIAQTPRKEFDSKFTFNPVLAKLSEVQPQESTKPQRERHSGHRLSADLERDLSLSESSEDDEAPKAPEQPARPARDARSPAINHPTPLIPTIASHPPVAPMSPMGMSPTGPITPERIARPQPQSQMRPPQAMPSQPQLQPPTQSQSQSQSQSQQQQQQQQSPQAAGKAPTNQRPPSPTGDGPASSGSASSSSDSGSDSCSDSSDDSEDEGHAGAGAGGQQPAQQPAKGPTTPPSVSPREAPEEPPPPAVEESKPRWNLSSFLTKTEKPESSSSSSSASAGAGGKEAKTAKEASSAQQPERRSSRHRDWELDQQPPKRNRSGSARLSSLSDSEQQSDGDKPKDLPARTQLQQQDKPKAPDVRKRGRPRKTDKSPKASQPQAIVSAAADALPQEPKAPAKRQRQRTSTSGRPKKQPISKPVLSSDEDDFSESDSEPAAPQSLSSVRRGAVASPVAVAVAVAVAADKRHRASRQSLSSNDHDDEDDDDDDDVNEADDDLEHKRTKRSHETDPQWNSSRFSPMKRSRKLDSPKKQDKKKSPPKIKPRRQRSRVSSAPECPSESDSETELTPRTNRKVARVQPRPRVPPTRTTSPDNSDSDNSPASVKLQDESGDNKKSALRRLFVAKSGKGSKGGKGGKGGGKCGIYVEEYQSNTPTGSESPYKRPSSVIPAPERPVVIERHEDKRISIPPITYINGVPRIICRIDLSAGIRVPQHPRGQETRQRTEIPDTRPSSRNQSGSRNQSQRSSTPEEGEIVETHSGSSSRHVGAADDSDTGPSHVKVSRGGGGSSGSRVIKSDEIVDAKSSDIKTNPSDSASGNVAGGRSSSCEVPTTGSGVKRKRKQSCSSESSLSTVSSVDSKLKNESKEEKKKRRKKHHEQQGGSSRHSNQQQSDIQPTNHEREERADGRAMFAQPEPHVRYYSYFYHQNEAGEDLDYYQDHFLSEAQRLKHSADVESELTTQALLYLEGISYFILTGQAMESVSSPVSLGAVYRMYKETLSLIKFITNKFKAHTDDSVEHSTHVKLIILSLWCQSLITQKLFNLRKAEIKETHSQLAEYQNKVLLQPEAGHATPSLSPTPSPGSVGSVGSQSSGYSSGELANRELANREMANREVASRAPAIHPPMHSYVTVPVHILNTIQKHHMDLGMLMNAQEKWDTACALVTDKHKPFFIELDESLGPLTPRSSLMDLVRYLQAGIKKLRGP